jgi:sensor c-di-GMP phosphodiesterase-like protein
MYKRMLILAVTMLLFILGISYLLVYTLKQNVTRERERQDKVYWTAYNAIEHFGERADEDSEHKAKIALDKARKEGLSKNRESILQNYFQDLQRCYQNEPESCKRVNDDMNQAIRAPTAIP